MNVPSILRFTSGPQENSKLAVFIFFLSVYLFTGQGSIQSADGKIMYLLTQSMVERHSLSFTERVSQGDPEGEKFSKYGIGMSVLAAPFYLAGKGLSLILPVPPSFATIFCVSMINALISALSCLLIYRLGCERFGFSHRISALLAVAYGLTTIAWFYSEDFMSEPVTSLLTLTAVFLWTGQDANIRNRSILLAGVCLGLALTCRLATAVVLPGFLLYLIGTKGNVQTPDIKSIASDAAMFLFPIAFFICLIFLYNDVRFDDFFETGYEKGFGTEGWTGFFGILFSPGKSVFLYNPILVAGVLAFPALIAFSGRKAFLFGWIILSQLLLFSFWHSWYGGTGWGPRLMLVTLPYLILPVGFLLQRGKAKTLVAAAMILGFLIQIPSVTVNVSRYYYDLRMQYQEKGHDLLLHSPAHSPILGQWKQVATVFSRLDDAEFLDRLVTQVRSGKRFLGQPDEEILQNGLALNAPNFWWVFMYLFGYSAFLTFFPAIVLLSTALFCGYKIVTHIAGGSA